MTRRPIDWINTPVIIEALHRYEQGILSRSMSLWVEELLDIESHQKTVLVHNPSKAE